MFFLWRKVKVLTYKFKGYFHKVWIVSSQKLAHN